MKTIDHEIGKFLKVMLFSAWLLSLALHLIVALSIPGIDWRLYALGASGGLSSFVFVAPYVFKKYWRG